MFRKVYAGFLSIAWPLNAMLTLFLLSAMLACGGCSTLLNASPTSATKAVETTCAAVGSAVQVIAIARRDGKLNAATVTSIDSMIAVTEPICTASTVPTLSQVELSAFNSAASQLAALSVQYGSTK